MRTTILVAGGLLALAGCGTHAATAAKEHAAPATTEAPVQAPIAFDETAEIQLMALEAAWSPETVCGPWRDAIATGVDYDMLTNFAVRKFEEGFGEPLEPATEARFLELLGEC